MYDKVAKGWGQCWWGMLLTKVDVVWLQIGVYCTNTYFSNNCRRLPGSSVRTFPNSAKTKKVRGLFLITVRGSFSFSWQRQLWSHIQWMHGIPAELYIHLDLCQMECCSHSEYVRRHFYAVVCDFVFPHHDTHLTSSSTVSSLIIPAFPVFIATDLTVSLHNNCTRWTCITYKY